jgi:TatD DNase family protein
VLIDSHCHLQHYAGEELRVVLARARARGIGEFLVPAVRLEEAEDLLALCDREPGVWCAIGVHPHDAASWSARHAAELQALAEHPKVVAIGECGLDFYYDHAPRDLQESVFRAQIELALEVDLPVVVHNRDSNAAMLRILESPDYESLAVDLHSFAGGEDMARQVVPLGVYFGVSGMVTFPRAANVRAALSNIPRDRLLLETDTPYLAPVPHRGERNEPAYVVEIAARLAGELGCEPDEVASVTSANFRRLFRRSG